MAKFGKDRFPSSYQKYVGMKGKQILHKNSKELCLILNTLVNLNNKHIFEIGSAGCRNLYYIWKENNNIKISASDLFKESSLEYTHPDIKNIVNFYEGDSEDIVKEIDFSNVDIILFSDHLMHLEYEKANNILKEISNNIKPEYILIREIKKEFEDVNHPRLYHNYDQLDINYDIIYDGESEQNNNYFIKLYKEKD